MQRQDDQLENGADFVRFANLSPQINSDIGPQQLTETMRALPVFMCFHLIAVALLGLLVQAEVPNLLLRSWQLVGVVIAGLVFAAVFAVRGFRSKPKQARVLLWVMPGLSLIFATLWILPLLLFSPFASSDVNIVLYGLTLVMWPLGVLTFLRLPACAILYACLTGVVLTWSAAERFASVSTFITLLCVAFWFSLLALTLFAHFDFQRRAHDDIVRRREGEIVKLLLNDFANESSDWLWETRVDGTLKYISARLSHVMHCSEEQLLGQDFFGLVAGSGESPLRIIMAEHQDFKDQRVEHEIQGQKYYWQISARALFDDAGQFAGYRGVGRDVTRQHEADLQLNAAKETAERANAAKTQFLSVVSHELRTPINSIVGFSEILCGPQSETLSAEDRRSYLDTVIGSAKHLQGLINNVLDATRFERGAFQLVEQDNDAAELVESAIKACRSLAQQSQVRIVARLIDDVTVRGDLARLRQVVLHLLTNAIKFSPAEAIVYVDMNRASNDALAVSVRDSGNGIDTHDTERVFDLFMQVDGSSTRGHEGMGLGLAIAKRIALAHDGDVELSSKIGFGTEAKLLLPTERITWPLAGRPPNAVVAA